MRSITTLALALALTLGGAPAAPAHAADAMALIPNDAVTVGVVRLADLRTSPLSSKLFEETDKMTADGDAEKFLAEAGLQPSKDIDVLVITTRPKTALGRNGEILIAADGRFNIERLTKALLARGAIKRNGYLVLPDREEPRGAVAFPRATLAIVGTESSVVNALATYAAGGTTFLSASGLGRDAARIEPKASAWAIVDVVRAARLVDAPQHRPRNDSAKVVTAALQKVSTVAVWATDQGDSLKIGAFGLASDAETLQLVEDAARGALAALRLAVQEKQPELVSVLRRFEVRRTDESVTLTGTIPAAAIRQLTAKRQASK